MKGLYKIILFAAVFALFSSSIVYSIPVFADVDLKKGPPGIPPAIKLKQGPSKDFVPGQILVGLKQADIDFKQKIKANIGEILDEIKENKSFLVKVPPNSEDAFIKSLQKNPKVEYAEKNFIVRALTNDSYWSYQWDMRIIDADDAWLTQTGDPSVIVAVVDTGVNYNHPDLAPRVTLGHDYAYDDNDPMDGNGHGTHVAGTVGATINNNRGVAGLAQVEIYAVKVLDDTGSGSITSVVDGIEDAVDYGADVINLSLGCYCNSQTLEEAINDANQEGVLVVAAAGNDNTNAILYPAGYSGAVSVSATNLNDLKASYSNYGSTIEISAPGGDTVGGPYWETYVLSTWKNNNYAFSVGTSMAAPHVAGVAALVKSQDPTMTNTQIRDHLRNTADDLGSLGWDQFYGYGRINALAAISLTQPSPPNQPPIANAGIDQNGKEGGSLTFDGLASNDPDGTIVSYDWNFGDGNTGIGSTTNHVYADNGSYTVSLTVTDDKGATASDTALVTVSNVAPTASANGPYSGNEGSVVTLSGSVTDPGTIDTHTFDWSFGDLTSGAGKTVSHTYSDNGLYTITLTVTDKDGGIGTDTTTATISNVPPTANAGGPYTGTVGSPVTFSGSATDPGADVLTYWWDFDYAGSFTADTSGVNLTGPSHTYAIEGTYTAALRVTDGDGGTSSIATAQVTIKPTNQSPVADAQSVATNEDTSITITLTGSDADGDSLTFTVTSGPSNGSLDTTAPATKAGGVSADVVYTPNSNFNGPDNFTFMVNDGTANSNTATVSITVNPVNDPPTANAQTVVTDEDTLKAITLTGSDADGDTLTFSVVSGPTVGALTGTAPNLTYTPTPDYNGPDSFTFQVSDDSGATFSAAATVSITVTPVNDTPVVTITSPAAPVTINVGDSQTFTGTASDVENGDVTASLVWVSDRDGTIGNGGSFSTSALTAGVHTVTATATDNAGATANDVVVVTVNPVSPSPASVHITSHSISTKDKGDLIFKSEVRASVDGQPNNVQYTYESKDGLVVEKIKKAEIRINGEKFRLNCSGVGGSTINCNLSSFFLSNGDSIKMKLELIFSGASTGVNYSFTASFDPGDSMASNVTASARNKD